METYELVLVGGTGLLFGQEVFLLHRLRPEEVRPPSRIVFVDGSTDPENERLSVLRRWAAECETTVEHLRPFTGDGHMTLGNFWSEKAEHPLLLEAALTAKEVRIPFERGFFADPKLSATAMTATRAVDDILARLARHPGCAHRVLCGSLAGGTGAGGLPLLTRRLRLGDDPSRKPPGHDGLHLHVLAFLPWFNAYPEGKGPAEEGTLRADWDCCLRNARGGVRSLLDIACRTAEAEHREAVKSRDDKAPLARAVETNVLLVGVDLARARTKEPPATPDEESGWKKTWTLHPLLRRAATAMVSLLQPRPDQEHRQGVRFGALCAPAEAVHPDADMHTVRRCGADALEALSMWPLGDLASTFGIGRLDDLPPLLGDMATAAFAVEWEKRPKELLSMVSGRWAERAVVLRREASEEVPPGATSVQQRDYRELHRALSTDSISTRSVTALRRRLLSSIAQRPVDSDARRKKAEGLADDVEEHVQAYFARATLAPRAAFPGGEGGVDKKASWVALFPLGLSNAPEGPTVPLCQIRVGESGLSTVVDASALQALQEILTKPAFLYSRPFASPLGIVEAMLDLFEDRGAAAPASAEAQEVILLWRAAIHGLLELLPPTPHDNRVLHESGSSHLTPRGYALSYKEVVIGFTAASLGFVPHVEAVDQERSVEADRSRVTERFKELRERLAPSEAEDKAVVRQFLETIERGRRIPWWVKLLDGWSAGTEAPRDRAWSAGPTLYLESSHGRPEGIAIPRLASTAKRPVFRRFAGGDWTLESLERLVPAMSVLEGEVRAPEGKGFDDVAVVVEGREGFMPCVPGVGLAKRDGETGVYVWLDQEGIGWDPVRDILTLDGEVHVGDHRHHVRIRLRFPAGFRPTLLSPKDVFASEVVRIAGMVNGRMDWVFPDVPVREERLHLVQDSVRLPESGGKNRWLVDFVGGVRREHQLAIGGRADVEVGSVKDRALAPMAIWPGSATPLPEGWRLFTLLAFDNEYSDLPDNLHVACHGATPARGLRRLDAGDRRTTRVFLSDERPRFVHVTKRCADGSTAEGAFLLPAPSAPVAPRPGIEIGLDFGTSNTCLAESQDAAVDQMDRTFPAPHVLVANTDVAPGVKPYSPWIPSLLVNEEESLNGRSMTQIPSSLYRTPGAPAQGGLPFGHYTFVRPSFSPALLDPSSWVSDLKWGAGGRDPERAARCAEGRRDFLRAVLCWNAIRWGGRRIHVRASYPLAFTTRQREDYGTILNDVLRDVRAWTGVTMTLAPPPGHPHDAPVHVPFADESTVLIDGGERSLMAAETGRPALRLVIAADIGGHTIDIVLGALTPVGAARTILLHRTLAAESLSIGANLLYRGLLEQTTPTTGEKNSSVHRYALERAVRLGVLAAEVHESHRSTMGEASPARSPLRPEPKGIERMKEILGSYFGLIRQSIARIVTGTLLDEANLVFRLVMAPGTGVHDTFAQEIEALRRGERLTVSIATLLSGNGWEWLRSAPRDRSGVDAWHVDLQQTARGHFKGSRYDVEWLPVVAESKELVVRRLVGLPCDGRNTPCVRPEAAPNGFDSAKKPSWTLAVGDGSLGAFAAARRTFSYPPAGKGTPPIVEISEAEVRARYAAVWPARDMPADVVSPSPPFEPLKLDWGAGKAADPIDITERQRAFTDADPRVLSTMRAWLEVAAARRFDPEWKP